MLLRSFGANGLTSLCERKSEAMSTDQSRESCAVKAVRAHTIANFLSTIAAFAKSASNGNIP